MSLPHVLRESTARDDSSKQAKPASSKPAKREVESPRGVFRALNWRVWQSLNSRTASAVGSRLDAVQLRVLPAFRSQLVVCADFRDASTVEHDDQVGHAHGGEAVRDEQRDATVRRSFARAAAAKPSNSACSVSASRAAVGSSSTSRSGSIAHEPARQGELLPLAERHLDAAWPRRSQLGVHARGQPRDDIASAAAIDGRPHGRTHRRCAARRRGRRSAGRGTRSGRSPETPRPFAIAMRSAEHARERHVVDQDGTCRRLVHLGEQFDQRRLAGAVLADDGHDPNRPGATARRRRARARDVPG